jgi:AraC-like DNA-binding protein/quercetin dioxygenase-like cupin family protein
MSKLRQRRAGAPGTVRSLRELSRPLPVFVPKRRAGAVVTTLTYDYPRDYVVVEHTHEEDQLVYASEGVMTVETGDAFWTVPPERAVWVPARVPHAIRMTGIVAMRTLYVRPGLARRMTAVRVLNVSPLLRELVVHVCAVGALVRKDPRHGRLLGVLLDLVEASGALALELPQPKDPRARRVAALLLEDPSDDRPIDRLCAKAGGSRRTVERAFEAETKMTLGVWRQKARCVHAIRLLASGASVTRVALETGYKSTSAFISMFRRVLGMTPGRYFRSA